MSPGDPPGQAQGDHLESLFLTNAEMALVQEVADRKGVTIEDVFASALSADLKRRFAPHPAMMGTVVPFKRG